MPTLAALLDTAARQRPPAGELAGVRIAGKQGSARAVAAPPVCPDASDLHGSYVSFAFFNASSRVTAAVLRVTTPSASRNNSSKICAEN